MPSSILLSGSATPPTTTASPTSAPASVPAALSRDELIRDGALPTVKLSRRRLVRREDLPRIAAAPNPGPR
jgi:hypothetical protein